MDNKEPELNSNLIHKVSAVRSTFHEEEVNTLLKEGWVLLSVGTGQEQVGQHDFLPSFRYCLGLIELSN